MLKQKYIGFYLITFSAVVLLVLPWLISDGMFMDGQQYACVAMNMAAGKGNFWFPVFTEIGVGGYSTFHEQAPLMFGLQSLFFKVLGNGFLTERIYGFCMLIVTILLMFKISKLLIKLKLIDKFYAFLPVLLWIIVPVVHWSFANNVVEITMGVFILLSFIFILKGTVEKSRKYLWLILAGINIFLASFTKGLPGIFVITVPFLFWFVFKNESFTKMLIKTLVPIFVLVLCYVVILLFPEARESMHIHWVTRVFDRIKSDPVVNYRAAVFISLITELLPLYLPVLFVLVMFFLKRKLTVLKKCSKLSLFFLLVGFSGSLPLMLTLVQRNFYYLGAIPFFAFSAAIVINPVIKSFIESNIFNKMQKYFNVITLCVFLASIVFSLSFYKKALRDKDILEDVYTIGDLVGKDSKIRTSGDILFNDWSFRCYLLRYYNIELVNYPPTDYHLYNKSDSITLSSLHVIECDLNNYTIYLDN